MKARLLIITNRLVIGGISNDIISVASYLKDNFEVKILYGEKESDEEDALFLLTEYNDVKVKKIKSLKRSFNLFADLSSYLNVKRELQKHSYQVVHTHGSKSGFIGRLAAYASGVRCIIHTFHGHLFHSYYNFFITEILKLTERLLGKITTKVVALSVSQFKDLTEVYKIIQPSKCSVIPLGIEHEKYLDKNTFSRRNFREQYQLRNSTIAIGIVGRMVPVKNHKLFVDIIVRLVKKSRKDIRFFFIGDGQLKRTIQQHLTQSGISWSEQNSNSNSTVIFTSWVSNIKESLHGIDILVLTSFNEGTPLSIIEAQLCGKPVVAANVGGVTDTFLNNETGFLINGHDPEQYIEKIGLLVDDANLRNSMGQKGSKMAMKKFSKNQEIKALSELYTTCLKSSKS